MRKLILMLGAGAIAFGSIVPIAADAQGLLLTRMMMRAKQRQSPARLDGNAPQAKAGQTIAYGRDAMQNLDLWLPSSAKGPVPLVLFVHGGGWNQGNKDNGTGKWKPSHYPEQGYGLASINYRLVPGVQVEDQAADVAHALAKLVQDADRLGLDRRKIVLMGHSAGAHLVALVGTDERYLRAAGLSFADLAGVVALDGAAYDVPRQMAEGNKFMSDRYNQAFGQDPARQRDLSPTLHASGPNVAQFLILHVQRPDGIAQSEALAAALKQGGSTVQLGSFPGTGMLGHLEMNRRMGDPSYAPTGRVDAWLKRLFGV